MAYYFLFPEKDTTLYSHPDRIYSNTGKDEIIELAKEKSVVTGLYYPSRILVKFKNEELKTVIRDVVGSTKFNNGNAQVSLQLMASEHKSLTQILNIETFPVSQSWMQGSDKYLDIKQGITSSNGASWRYTDDTNYRTEWTTASFGNASTGSINSNTIQEGGGTWYTGSELSLIHI